MVSVGWAVGGFGGEEAVEFVDAGDGCGAEGDDDVSGLDSGLLCWAGFLDVVDHDGGVDGEFVFVDEAAGQRDVLAGDADPAAADAAVEQELGGDEFGGVDADGEAEALRGHDGRGVDADDLAARVDERAAGVAGVEGGVGLDDLVHHAAAGGAHAAAEGADDSGGDGELESVGVADGDGELADFEGLRSSEGGWRQHVRRRCGGRRCRCRGLRR